MKKIIVASLNPSKISAVKIAFESIFPDWDLHFEGLSVSSGVSDQPMDDEETYQGAFNRAQNAQLVSPEADFWIGLEGGVENRYGNMNAFAWMVILNKNLQGVARTASFTLPPAIKKMVEQGIELGEADDQFFDRKNSKQTNGAVGILSHDHIDRANYYAQALKLALIPFLNPDFYPHNR